MKRKLLSLLVLLLTAAMGAWAQAEALINGLFTINAEGNQVVFAQGNLQAVCTSADGDASTQETFTWRFAEHQWDYIGGNYSGGSLTSTGNNFIDGSGSVSAEGTVDLFSWVGESSSLTGVAAYGICLWGLGGNNPEDGLKSDWGNLFGDDWHALSKDEWDYIFNTRSTTSGVRYAKATVNGVAGVILLPDDWSTSYYTLKSTNTATAAFSANSINSTNWTNSLEAHGAVFLPAGGNRSSGSVWNQNTYGFYWSSSPVSAGGEDDGNKASLLIFYAGDLQAQYTENRGYGFSVRLVKNVRIDVTGVTLNASTATLTVGGTTTLTPTFTPSNATNKNVTWSSSNTSVATVSNSGVVTAVGLGTATITATATNGTADTSDDLSTTCTVTVAAPINALSEVGTVGAFTDVNGQTRLGIVTMLNGSKYAISMSNETDISGLSGTYTKKVGDYTYYNFADACAKFANNQTDGSYIASNVWRLPTAAEFQNLIALGGSWNGTGYTWTIGGNSLFLPAAGYNDASPVSGVGYYWSSTQPQFLYFYEKTIFMTNGGTSSGMPLRLFCQLSYVNVTGVTLAQTEGVLTVGETLTLTATIAPINATDKSVTWTTSDAGVCTVTDGVVTAVAAGTATITVTATNGTADPSDDVTATCTVTVATPINAVSEDGTIGAFTDANGQTRMGIVVTLNGNKYAISMNEETDLSGLSGTYTKKVGSHTYYNQADACQKFANNKADGSYNVANVWRLPTATEMSYLVALGGSAWDGTEGHQGYTWTIGSNSLFLPAAGYYDNGGVTSSDWGYYWTSGGGTGNMLCFTSWYTASIGSGGTQSGMPLRLFCQLPYTAVTGVTLSPTEASLIVGETTTLTPTVAPATATDMTVTWTTSDASVATVSNGVVTAVGAGTATITVTATNGTVDTSDDKTATCAVTVSNPTYNLTANEGATGEFWATFYSDASNYQASSGTQVFMVNLSGTSITMTPVTGGIVKSSQGVVLKNTTGSNITMTPTISASSDDWTDNSLTGTMTNITNPGNAYVLNYKAATGAGFYKLKDTGTIGANKAYLTYSGGGSLAPEFFGFDGNTTGIDATLVNSEKVNSVVYDLQGRRVAQPTKGLYIVNGKKVVIK